MPYSTRHKALYKRYMEGDRLTVEEEDFLGTEDAEFARFIHDKRAREQALRPTQTPPPPAPVTKVEYAHSIKTQEQMDTACDECAAAIHAALENGDLKAWGDYCITHCNEPAHLAVAIGLVFEFVAEMNAKNRARAVAISALDARVTGLEARPVGVTDKGIWMSGTEYPAGSGVSRSGSYWVAQRATTAMPGSAGPESTGWRLCAKAGRDGKDLR